MSSVKPAFKEDGEATAGNALHGDAAVSHDNVSNFKNRPIMNWPKADNPDWLWLHKAIYQDELVQSNAEADKGDTKAANSC